MYYLNQRYYNPEWRRFINADDYAGSTGALLSHNVYAYCANNPVMCSDPSGNIVTYMPYGPYAGQYFSSETYKFYSNYNDAVFNDLLAQAECDYLGNKGKQNDPENLYFNILSPEFLKAMGFYFYNISYNMKDLIIAISNYIRTEKPAIATGLADELWFSDQSVEVEVFAHFFGIVTFDLGNSLGINVYKSLDTFSIMGIHCQWDDYEWWTYNFILSPTYDQLYF